LTNLSCSIGDIIITEGEKGEEIFFIIEGGVSMVEKASNTFLCNLGLN